MTIECKCDLCDTSVSHTGDLFKPSNWAAEMPNPPEHMCSSCRNRIDKAMNEARLIIFNKVDQAARDEAQKIRKENE